MTSHNSTPVKALEQELIKEFGWLVGGADLVRLLGYPSAAAFRQAASRQRLPVRIFPIAGRRGQFAWVPEIASWLARLGEAALQPEGGTSMDS